MQKRRKTSRISSICAAVILLCLLIAVLTGCGTPAADTSNDSVDTNEPEVVVQDPGIANCKAYYVDWYADDEPYALTLAMSEDSVAGTVTAEQLQAMIDEKGCTTLVVEQFDNANMAMWLQIRELTGIETLCIDYCTASELNFLSGMRDLKTLAFNISQVDLTGIGALTNLIHLSLDVCNIDDISPLSGLVNLQSLYSRRNYISDLSPLSGLTQLADLSIINYNDPTEDELPWQLTDLTPLANLTNLRSLDLSQNRISDLTPLANLTNLTTLNLSANKITDISPLANLTKLTTLNLTSNAISDWSPMANLTKLETLEPDVQIGG